MGRPLRLLALLGGVALGALCAPSAATTFDMTGRWQLDFYRSGSLLISRIIDFAQTGESVVGDYVPADGLPEYTGFIAAGSAEGGFTLDGPPSCGPSVLFGRVAPDGQTLTGIQDSYVFFDMPPLGCTHVQADVEGTRVELVPRVCGNGIIEVPEQCDDGNVAAGDGCGADCRVEACSSCSGQPSTCIPVTCGLCESSPRLGCRKAPPTGKVTLALEERTPDEGDRLTWKWSRGESTLAEFGDPPHSGRFALCVYDRSVAPPVRLLTPTVDLVVCGGKPCWKAKGKGFTYRDRAATEGVQSIRLRAGVAGHAVVQVKGKGPNLRLPPLPVRGSLALTVQLQAGDGPCWEADYTAAGVVTNDTGRLRARPE